MTPYYAIVEDTKYPLGYIKWIEGKRIDSINRKIENTRKTWPGLELPKKLKHGHVFEASYGGMKITIGRE